MFGVSVHKKQQQYIKQSRSAQCKWEISHSTQQGLPTCAMTSHCLIPTMQVESQTRHDIDKKKFQLRQTVGDSYHELISSANLIQTMADNCKSVADDLDHIRGVFRDLARDLTSNNDSAKSEKRGMTESQLQLYGTSLQRFWSLIHTFTCV